MQACLLACQHPEPGRSRPRLQSEVGEAACGRDMHLCVITALGVQQMVVL